MDAASEQKKGKTKIGSTLKGIGPAYKDKIGREGLRIGDLFNNFREKYSERINNHKQLLSNYFGYDYEKMLTECENEWFASVELLKKFQIIDSEHFINELLENNKSVLAEGAQGTLLDVDFGSYPFVTSSNTICAGACTGLGLAPQKIDNVFGVFKAYCTRVGMGPFPTELTDETGDKLRDAGKEYGSTTGRPRRCGWLDLVALKYSVMLNGVSELIMMKADVLDSFKSIKIAVGYEIDGKTVNHFPFELTDEVKPVYAELPGWHTDITEITHKNEFPRELKDYISFIEKEMKIPVSIASVGPKRKQTIIIKE